MTSSRKPDPAGGAADDATDRSVADRSAADRSAARASEPDAGAAVFTAPVIEAGTGDGGADSAFLFDFSADGSTSEPLPPTTGAMRGWTPDDLADAELPPGSAIAGRLRDILTLSHAFERRLGAALTVNSTDLTAMEHLINDGPLSPSDLAKRLGVTTAASTLVVDRLVGLGHVERRPHPRDRRKIIVVPAHASVSRAFDELLPVIAGVSELVGALPDADRAVVEKFLGGVVSVYRDAVTAP